MKTHFKLLCLITHSDTRAHIHITHTRVHTHVHPNIHTSTYSHTHAYIHKHAHTHAHPNDTHIYIHTHAYTHARANKRTHIHTATRTVPKSNQPWSYTCISKHIHTHTAKKQSALTLACDLSLVSWSFPFHHSPGTRSCTTYLSLRNCTFHFFFYPSAIHILIS